MIDPFQIEDREVDTPHPCMQLWYAALHRYWDDALAVKADRGEARRDVLDPEHPILTGLCVHTKVDPGALRALLLKRMSGQI